MLLKWNNFATIYLLKFVFINLPANSHQGIHERRLLEDIFGRRRYNQYERPVANESDALIVTFGLTLQQIIAVDEKNQIINTNIWLNLNWTDSNLSWNKSEYGGLSSIRLPPKSIWKPDILMYNSADEDIDSTFPTNVIVSSNGACLWVPPGMFLSTCKIDITWFPFDDQKCTMKFGSWTYDGESIDLRLQSETGDISSFIENGEWKLIGAPAERNVLKYECCSTPYYDVTFTIHIRRRTLYYGFNLIIPCVLISSMAMLSFTLPPDAGEKISLGVTILLSLMMFLLLVAETMPPNSDTVALIGMYFGCILMMTSLSVVFTVLVLIFHHRTVETHTMPQWIRKGICEWLAWILLMKRPGREITRKKLLQKAKMRDLELRERSSRSLLANVLDLEDDFRSFINHNAHYASIRMDDANTLESHPCERELKEILKEVKVLTNKVKRDEDEKEATSDWKFAAMVIDRFCLIIFILFNICATCGTILNAPQLIVD